MVCEKFAEIINDGSAVSNSSLDCRKMQSLLVEAEKKGIKKMEYEHPGQAAWRRRWDNIPAQFATRFD